MSLRSCKQTLLVACLLLAFCLSQGLSAHPSHHARVQYLDNAIALKPRNQQLYMQRGQAYSDDGEFQLARDNFLKAETLGPVVAVAYDLGVLAYRQRQFEEALRYLNLYLAYRPKHILSLQYRARLFRDAGKFDKAIIDFNKLLRLQKMPNPGHYLSVANMLVTIHPTDYSLALKTLDDGMQRLGIIPQLQQRAIALNRETGDYVQALQRHASMKQLMKHSPRWQVTNANLLLQSGSVSQSKRQLNSIKKELTELRPTGARLKLLAEIDNTLAKIAALYASVS